MHIHNPITKLVQTRKKRDVQRIILLSVTLLIMIAVALCAGEMWILPDQWLSETAQLFVWDLRFPRVLAVIAVGAGLAMAGAVMQAIFENPLAEPGLLGVSNGAGVFVVFIVLFFKGMPPLWVLGGGAVSGATLLTLILLWFAHFRRLSNSQLLLVGVALGVICGAFMTWMVYFSTSLDLRQLMYWMMGSFSGADWRLSPLLAAIAVVAVWLLWQAPVLNYLALGEVNAQQLGVSAHRWRNVFIIAVGLLIGLSVAVAGAISFIGLIIPHMLRLMGITDHRTLLPACALFGAVSLLLADLCSRLILSNAEIPIGVVTATIGAPAFIYLLTRHHGGRR
ncbi:vitamin B12 ABC transporter permease BtuC [Morganella morganii]